jgi:diguanylate cyclase (GGDEF)-like protein
MLIGRSASCGLTLAHPSVSRNHCRIWREDGQIWIEDLGSTNRTRVNGRALDRTVLRDGDQISVGQDDLKYFEGASAEARYHQELIDLALYDSLTGFLNRRQFRVLLEKACDSGADGAGFALLLLDLDHFKQVNDRYGHLVGDQVLAAVSKALRENVGDHGEFGRIGGEEFALLAPGLNAQQAVALAEALRVAVSTRTIEPGPVTVSIGVAAWDGQHSAPGEAAALLVRADEALYRAKGSGRNKVVLAE